MLLLVKPVRGISGGCARYQVLKPDTEETVGEIFKRWQPNKKEGEEYEMFVKFQRSLTPEMKALCLGMLFLLDYIHFEIDCPPM